MIGKAHLQMLRACLLSRKRRDTKRIEHPLSQERLAVIEDCEKILCAFAVRLDIDAIELAQELGWIPEEVVLGSLRLSAQEWLDARHTDFQSRGAEATEQE